MKTFTWRTSNQYKKLKKENASRVGKIIFITLLAVFSLGLLYQVHIEQKYNIYEKTLRFHIRASSDDAKEQQIKLEVRDAVLAFLKKTADSAENAKELERQLMDKKEEICEIAEQTLKKLGVKESVKVALTKERFPLRTYGTMVFPAGEYRSLRVDLGAGEGHNWWCALYPELCYSEEEQFILSGKGREDVENSFSEEEQKVLAGKKIKLRFKILEWLKNYK